MTANLVLLNSIIYVHLSSNRTGSISGSLSVVLSVSESYVYYEYTCEPLYKALYFRVCISLAKRFIVPQGLHIRLGIEIMVFWVGRHHLCAVHVINDRQYVVFDCCNVYCVDVYLFFRICCFEVLYDQLWNVLHF